MVPVTMGTCGVGGMDKQSRVSVRRWGNCTREEKMKGQERVQSKKFKIISRRGEMGGKVKKRNRIRTGS